MTPPLPPPYTADELATRISDGSIDLPRLGATVANMQVTLNALAEWANKQIKAQVPTAPTTEQPQPDVVKPHK